MSNLLTILWNKNLPSSKALFTCLLWLFFPPFWDNLVDIVEKLFNPTGVLNVKMSNTEYVAKTLMIKALPFESVFSLHAIRWRPTQW